MVEQRKSTRFELHLPLRVMQTGADYLSNVGLTRNISSHGVLFTSEVDVPIGGAIEYVVTLSAERQSRVDLRCFGKVVRLELSPTEFQTPGYLIAATMDRYQVVRHGSLQAGAF